MLRAFQIVRQSYLLLILTIYCRSLFSNFTSASRVGSDRTKSTKKLCYKKSTLDLFCLQVIVCIRFTGSFASDLFQYSCMPKTSPFSSIATLIVLRLQSCCTFVFLIILSLTPTSVTYLLVLAWVVSAIFEFILTSNAPLMIRQIPLVSSDCLYSVWPQSSYNDLVRNSSLSSWDCDMCLKILTSFRKVVLVVISFLIAFSMTFVQLL